ncbi:MAG: hypothetical protein AAGE01_16960 [Pseudomonadota bacterium]
MHKRPIIMALGGLLLVAMAVSARGSSLAASKVAFLSAAAACARIDRQPWPIELCGPMLIADRTSGLLIANQADPEGRLRAVDGVFTAAIPEGLGLANTAVDLWGTRWALVVAPLPQEAAERDRLLLHESFHRIQPQLGLPTIDAGNGHVDDHPGRLWLRLEWRALAVALAAENDAAFRSAVGDALLFRLHRYELLPGAREAETALELNEGLAEYTAMRMAFDEPAARIIERLTKAQNRENLVRSFAYESGPAWGLVLDRLCAAWLGSVQAGANFADLASCFVGSTVEATPEARAGRYGYADVRQVELARESERRALIASLEETYLGGPIVELPLAAMSMQFDPNRVTAFPSHGTVYGGLTLSDHWGRIEGADGLISEDFTRLVVPGPAEKTENGAATSTWTLDLAAGWSLEPGERPGLVRAVRTTR